MLLERNLEFGFVTKRERDTSRLKTPLAEQLRSFQDFGKSTQLIETTANAFGGERVLLKNLGWDFLPAPFELIISIVGDVVAE
jgi:hypothetical protein